MTDFPLYQQVYIPSELVYVHPNQLNDNIDELEADIAANGLQIPVLVRQEPHGLYHVFDGNHRALVYRKWRKPTPCFIIEWAYTDDPRSMEIFHRVMAKRHPLDPFFGVPTISIGNKIINHSDGRREVLKPIPKKGYAWGDPDNPTYR